MLQSAKEYRASSRAISIYNSLGGMRVTLDPIDQSPVFPQVKMYVCGLTPQDHAHLGHGLVVMRFDIVRRYMMYRRLNVLFIQNVTDIDDKIIAKVLTLNVDPLVMTRQFTDDFYASARKLHALPVDKLTKVTEFVPQIISFIQKLIDKGFAYATPEGSVYFDVSKKDDYGKLSNQNTSMLYESVRKELDKEKRSPLDFALWKRDESTSLSSSSPWGVGRPGWHIECSAMIHETLGDRIDIHGGGLDLKFPHHENEIAQSEAHSGVPLANIWMHNGLLNIEGQKMSKSLNNFVRLDEALEHYGITPLRFVIARHHYRSGIDLSDKLFKENLNSLLEFHRLFEKVGTSGMVLSPETFDSDDEQVVADFEAAMDNDFNSPEALVVLEKARSKLAQLLESGAGGEVVARKATLIRELGAILGLFFDTLDTVEREVLSVAGRISDGGALTQAQVQEVINERTEARKAKDFARSDELRKKLLAHGVDVLDTKAGTSWRVL